MGFGIIVFASIVPLMLVMIWMIFSYNSLQRGRLKVENSWGQINVQLKMRSDVVPNLVNIVSGYAKHEQETLTKVMQARNSFLAAKTPQEVIQASGEMGQLMGRLFAVAESYPDLKANQGFLNLQVQLSELEQKIAMYRQFYNDTVMMYNRNVVTFPGNIPAGLFGFVELPYFNITEQESIAPVITF